MSISLIINNLYKTIDKEKLIIVSKKQPYHSIMDAYKLGHKDFGENRVQELLARYSKLPKSIRWHMIGHLQTNKVKNIAPFIYIIHTIDSLKLLKKVNIEAEKNNRIIKCLLQIHIAQETGKYGFKFNELNDILSQDEWRKLTHVSITGVMGMATFTNDMNLIRREFKTLKKYYDKLKKLHFSNDTSFKEISMGMSQDYKVALEEGATMIRIGSLIFNN